MNYSVCVCAHLRLLKVFAVNSFAYMLQYYE
jgi:hypothetical protein